MASNKLAFSDAVDKKISQLRQKTDVKINSITNAKIIEKEIFEKKRNGGVSNEQLLKEIRTMRYLKEHSKVSQNEYVDIIMNILGLLLIFAVAARF